MFHFKAAQWPVRTHRLYYIIRLRKWFFEKVCKLAAASGGKIALSKSEETSGTSARTKSFNSSGIIWIFLNFKATPCDRI